MATTVASPAEERVSQASIRPSTRVSRRSHRAEDENVSSSRFFLPKSGSNANTLELGCEFMSEGEARVEALKLGVTYYSVQEWRSVANFAGKNPELKREAVFRKGAG